TRLDALATVGPPGPKRTRPPWCGHCDERTRLRESDHDHRLYRCPDCHPRMAIAAGSCRIRSVGSQQLPPIEPEAVTSLQELVAEQVRLLDEGPFGPRFVVVVVRGGRV